MSSTNRGSERADLDQYFTPRSCAHAIVQRLLDDGVIGISETVLEPHAGRGAFVKAVHDLHVSRRISMCELELQPEIEQLGIEFEHTYMRDFLTLVPDVPPSLIIGNPPFSGAEPHVAHALEIMDSVTGVVALLLRLSFLEGAERHRSFWPDRKPSYIYVLDRRPSFKETLKPVLDEVTGEQLFKKDGTPRMKKVKNDSAAYGVFVWRAHDLQRAETQDPCVRFLAWKDEKKSKTAT